jgi:hypothetical protein
VRNVTIYIVLNDYETGLAFIEAPPAEADRETTLRNFLSGEYSNAQLVVAFNTTQGWSQDVSEDIAGELLERALDAGDTLADATKRFIDRYVTGARSGHPRHPNDAVGRAAQDIGHGT